VDEGDELDACTKGKPEQFTPEEGSAFDASNNLFRGCIISILVENLVDAYIRLVNGKKMWDVVEAQYGVANASSELYIMEQFLDYRMVEDCSMVEQAHEIHMLAKDLMCVTQQVCGRRYYL
jgi:3'-phosphoadenosine 5'-phosphosulfate (PAPS) 3'-phosphatase